jgi:hypothetical protein
VPLLPAATGDIVRETGGNLRPALDTGNDWQQWQPPAIVQRLAQHLVNTQQGGIGGGGSAAAAITLIESSGADVTIAAACYHLHTNAAQRCLHCYM